MNKEKAILFLKNHQPMPEDSKLDEQTIEMYDEVRKFFMENPDKECLPLFLNSFGEYDGNGVYQLVEDVILKFEHEEVVSCLSEALKSSYSGVKYWCAQICSLFPDRKLIKSLEKLLTEDSDDIRIAALTSLSIINDSKILTILKNHYDEEPNEEVKDFLSELINDIEEIS